MRGRCTSLVNTTAGIWQCRKHSDHDTAHDYRPPVGPLPGESETRSSDSKDPRLVEWSGYLS